jgi:Reverse transcriptase (RNA-dependent DNA polymerase).
LYDILIKFGVTKMLVTIIKTCLDGTQNKVRIGNYLSTSFPFENILKQGDALLPLVFNLILNMLLGRYRKLTWDWI